MARSPSERREASRKSDFVLVKKEDIPLLYTKPVVHFDFKKVVPLIEFQTLKKFKQLQLNIMNNLGQSYKKILEVLSKFFGNKLQNYQRRTPKISDLEAVSLVITAEYLSIDSQCQLFRKTPEAIKSKIERSVF